MKWLAFGLNGVNLPCLIRKFDSRESALNVNQFSINPPAFTLRGLIVTTLTLPIRVSSQILALLQGNELAARLGKAGQQAVRTDWNRGRFAGDMKNLYRQMLVGKKKGLDERIIRNVSDQFGEKKL
jgi:hypothetical protein